MTGKTIEQLLKEKRIDQIIRPRVIHAPQTISIKETVELMREMKSGYVILTDGTRVAGIFTETDVVNKVLERDVDWTKPVSEVMTRDPVVLKLGDSVGMAIDTMAKRYFYHIPLVDEKGHFANVISVRTIIRFLAEYFPTEVFNLPPDHAQISVSPEGG